MNNRCSLIRCDYLSLHAFLLVGYALLGKAFAYQGLAPLYVGEAVMALGTCGFLVSARRWMALRDWTIAPLALFMLWGAVLTVPGVFDYGIVALRDAVIWGYGWFAILTYTILVTERDALYRLMRLYANFCRVAVLLITVILAASSVLGWISLEIGGRSLPVLKGGEIMVHACGVLAFLYAFEGRLSAIWLFPLPVFVFIGMTTRAGLLSFLGTVVTLQLLRPARRRWWLAALALAVGLVVLAVTELRVAVPGTSREISFDALTGGFQSVFQDTGTGTYDGTKRWRLQWWDKILDYTWRGDYFWSGKGFGINLADDDGFVLDSTRALRSPHNGHLTVLARAGVPGFALWALTQGVWAAGMLAGYVRARKHRNEAPARTILFLLAYWVGFMVNASFDVFLEGPMGGVWFWTVYGAGLAVLRVPVRSRPEAGRGFDPAAGGDWSARGAAAGLARC
jgi:O-antigen ligase